MTEKELQLILQEGEGQTIEFKESFSSGIAKEIVAFANAGGGRIFIGITDVGKIKVVDYTNALKSQILDLARNCDPSITVNLQYISGVVVLEIAEGVSKPYQCRDGFFLRQGANSQKLSRDEIVQFGINEARIRFDSQINHQFQYPRDFSREKLAQYLKAIDLNGKYLTEDILVNLGVAQRKHKKILFNNTGVLFFAKEPCRFFPSAYIDAVVFKGSERVDVIDRKTFKAGLLENLSSCRVYLSEHLNLSYDYPKGWKREDKYEIPLNALREAVVNAIMHRDYFISGANISLCLFDDRVEIVSPGGLPKPLRVEDLGKKSQRRNELIADLFSRLDFVEKLGTGISKMKALMRKVDLPIPSIEVNGFFTIAFQRPQPTSKMSVKNVGKMSVKNVGKAQRREIILKKVQDREKFTLESLAKEVGVNSKTIERDIKALKAKVNMRFIGPKRGGFYQVEPARKTTWRSR